MWIAKDMNGSVNLFLDKPIRDFEEGKWTPSDKLLQYITIPSLEFADRRWEDEPLEVILTEFVKRSNKITNIKYHKICNTD